MKADEGLWLYSQPPTRILDERYGFEPGHEWLDHLQKSSVNVGGASGSFVSPDGLLISNHHVVSGVLQRMSSAQRNLIRDGFYAKSRKDELPCPGLEISVLIGIENVTERVNAAVKEGASDQDAYNARKSVIAQIEADGQKRTGLRCHVVTLFQGAQYHLYMSKRYTDVRLVFAPEEQAAFFGGDVDNFEFPRWNLDIAFVRAYENGVPARVEHFLKWSAKGPQEGELLFISGHPARTDRLKTVAQLKFQRDVEYPETLERLKRTEVLLAAFSKRSAENARRARGDLRSLENGRKRRDGTLAGLLDPALMETKIAEENRLRSAAETRPELQPAKDAWNRIAAAQEEIAKDWQAYGLLESGQGFNSGLFSHARRLLRAAEERSKPEGERLEEYRSTGLQSIELALGAEQPFYEDLETLKLADSLTYLAEKLGAEAAMTKKVLAGKSPKQRAGELVKGTRLASVAVRKELFGDPSKALASKDPMIELARLVDADARAVRARISTRTEAIRQAQALIGRVRYALDGDKTYPDATGTLRLAFGTATGIPGQVPMQTTFSGLYERAKSQDYRVPFDLPKRWLDRRSKLNLNTPFNFVMNGDSLGGNSGSPVVNKKGEFVGVLFDGNIDSLVLDVAYEGRRARSVVVHSSGILEALRKMYGVEFKELQVVR